MFQAFFFHFNLFFDRKKGRYLFLGKEEDGVPGRRKMMGRPIVLSLKAGRLFYHLKSLQFVLTSDGREGRLQKALMQVFPSLCYAGVPLIRSPQVPIFGVEDLEMTILISLSLLNIHLARLVFTRFETLKNSRKFSGNSHAKIDIPFIINSDT